MRRILQGSWKADNETGNPKLAGEATPAGEDTGCDAAGEVDGTLWSDG